MLTRFENIRGAIIIGVGLVAVVLVIGSIFAVEWDINPSPHAVQVMNSEDCENDKVLLIFEDGKHIARYAGLCSIHTGVFFGHDGKYEVQMYACKEGRVGMTFIADNQSFQLVDE